MLIQPTRDAWADAMREARENTTKHADQATLVCRSCSDCGYEFAARKDDKRRSCPHCSAWRGVEAREQLRAREGPYYERAVRKQLKHWTAEAKRLGL